MKISLAALVTVGLVGHASSQCSQTCLTDMPGGPFTCDELISTWNNGADDNSWMGYKKNVTCRALEEFNCCDCSGCECSGTTTTTTTTSTTTTTKPECYACWSFLFGGDDDTPAGFLNDQPGFEYQFQTPVTTGWEDLDLHVRAEGCEAAALNGLDCSGCGCDCGEGAIDEPCEQDEFATCGDCSVTECGETGSRFCTYNTVSEGSGLGAQCQQDFFEVCVTDPCPVTTEGLPMTTMATTTIEVLPNCSASFEVDGINILDVDGLGGSCESASLLKYCNELSDQYGADCFECDCVCDPAQTCNSRMFHLEQNWPIFDGECYTRSECKDPCTEYIGNPEFSALNATCEELLQTREMHELDDLFEVRGQGNYCREFDCCTNFSSGGGIPDDDFGQPSYTCYEPTTTTTTTSTMATTTTTECQAHFLTLQNESWSVDALTARGLTCFQIAYQIYVSTTGGPDDNTDALDIVADATYFPEAPYNLSLLELAERCGCEDSCVDSCQGCNSLFDAFDYAGFDMFENDYFCSDIETDFNLDCRDCGCLLPDVCDEKILFASNSTRNSTNPYGNRAYDLSCNQLSELGLNCNEIETYTNLHELGSPCADCACDVSTEEDMCNVPCGGGQYGGNTSSGFLNESQILTCYDFVSAGFSCQVAAEAGCTECGMCGCQNETTTPPETCDSECNDLSLSCNELVEHFTCLELEADVFDGCGCNQCGCENETVVEVCGTGCMEGMTCDEWVSTNMSNRYFYTCEILEENYGCNCDGCECLEFTSEPPADANCATSSCLEMDCETVQGMTGLSFYDLEDLYDCDCTGCAGCDPVGCDGVSCDIWQAELVDGFGAPLVTCEELESSIDGCDCHGCSCFNVTETEAPEELGCLNTCTQLGGPFGYNETYTCDELRAVEDTLTCAYMEAFYACDCQGCLCEDVPDLVCEI